MSTFLLTLIHCMSAQYIEREWISLTCTWLVVWGRVQIRLQRRPSVKLLYIEFSTTCFSLFLNPLSCTQTPFGDIRVTDSESSCTFCSYVACFNANIDSCLLRLELNCMPYCFTYLVLIWLVPCHHRNYAFYHLPTQGRA